MSLDPVIAAPELSVLSGYVLLDCRPDEAGYRVGHVRNAFHAQLERDLSAHTAEPARGGRHPLPDARVFSATLGRWGIRPATHVVAYDEQGGANAAARLWWLLRALGHVRVQVVDGGLPSLLAAGFAQTSELPVAAPTAPYPADHFSWPVADIDEVERARSDPSRRLIDVRAAVRYRGEAEPIDPLAGHIPGALNVPLSENLRADGRFKSASELRALYAPTLAGSTPEQTIVHCGSGVTACHSLLALERAALPGAKLYVGSWSEWCRDPSRERASALG
jgi:thiosulfate/3-mercaptopyruvate sulfurtransferase